MNSQSINAFKCLAIENDRVKFLISILAQGMGVAIAHFVFCDSLQKKKTVERSDKLLDFFI
jgi:hypothetical protein